VAEAEEQAITVFLADDNVIVREGVRALLALEPDLKAIGTAGECDELTKLAALEAPYSDSTRSWTSTSSSTT
jgi:hypothetical protein